MRIENNEENEVFEQEIQNGTTLLLKDLQLPNGLYYYKLLQENRLVKLGKFYVFQEKT